MKEKMERSEDRKIKPAQSPREETTAEAGVVKKTPPLNDGISPSASSDFVNLNPINNPDSQVNEATEPSD